MQRSGGVARSRASVLIPQEVQIELLGRLRVHQRYWSRSRAERALQAIIPFTVDEIPSGYAAGVHVTKLYESAVADLRASADFNDVTATLETAQARSALITASITRSNRHRIDDRWAKVSPPPASFVDAVDQLYEPRGGWLEFQFDMIVKGSEHRNPR